MSSSSPQVRFADPLLLAWGAMSALAAGIAFDLVWLFRLVSLEATPAIATQVQGGWGHFWIRIATAILFLIWVDRVYGNLPSLGEVPEHPRFWATLSFFVPPIFLFRPYNIVEESWRRSSREGESSLVVLGWWIAFLIPIGISVSGIRPAVNPLPPVDRWWRFTGVQLFNVIAAFLAIYIVYQISERQREAREAYSRMLRETAAEEARLKREAALRGFEPRTATLERPMPVPAVPIAPAAVRPAPPPPRRPSAPNIAAIATAAPRKATLPQRGHTIPPAFWRSTLLVVAAVSALTFLIAGGVLASRSTYVPAGINGAFGVLVAGAALLVLRRKSEETSWAPLALAALLLTIINIVAVAEVVIG